mmetsp:Transcript_39315/g.76962  ORF Transcript_39315/g.76962 Transcript_39315/m.76962 type:complete len:367 (+) Transcript_39315:478-1578(+)
MDHQREGKDAKRARRMASGASSELSEMVKCAREDEAGDYLTASARLVEEFAREGRTLHQWHPSRTAAATRGDGVDIVFRVCECYKVASETICSSVLILDRFLERAAAIDPSHPSYPQVARLSQDAPLLSVACFLIMCKFRERVCPLLPDLEALWEGRCSVQAIKSAEVTILATVDWNLRCVTALEVANKIMAVAPKPMRAHMLQQVEFLVEIAYYSRPMMRYPSTSVAVAAIRYAAERLNIPDDSLGFVPQWLRTAQLDDEVLGVLETCFAAVQGDEVPMAVERDDDAAQYDAAASQALTQDHGEVPSCAMDLEDDRGDEEDEEQLLSPTNVDMSGGAFSDVAAEQHTKASVGGSGFACSGMPEGM